jgi:membrane fusion protein (multidrug efflux system)
MRQSITLLLLMGCFVISACSDKKNAPKKPKPDHLVEVITVAHAQVSIERERTGTLQALQEIQIFNQEEGRIIDLPFYEGDVINQGDIVARMDVRLLQSQLARTQALRKKAEKDLARMRNIANKRLMAEAEMTRAETDLAVARADEQALNTRLDYATLTSPISGLISQRLSEPGNIAERYSHLLTVSDQSQLITEVSVSELLINKLNAGDAVTIYIDALAQTQEEGVQGTITRIHPNLDPVTRNGIVEIALSPVPQGARPGQFARVILRSQKAERLLIPFAALRRSSEGEYVFYVNDQQKASIAKVVSGLRVGSQVEILSGLAVDQQIIVRGFTNLRTNKKVMVVPNNNAISTVN